MSAAVWIIIVSVAAAVSVPSLIFLVKAMIDIAKGRRRFDTTPRKLILQALFLALYSAMIWMAMRERELMFRALGGYWDTVRWVIWAGFGVFAAYYFLTDNYRKSELRIFSLSVIGLMGALGYSSLMFLIDLVVKGASSSDHVWSFLFVTLTYIYAQRLTRINMVRFANEQVKRFRAKLCGIVLRTTHEALERTDTGRIYTCVVNDMETLGGSMRDIVTVITNLTTVIVCFVYLAIVDAGCFAFAFAAFIIGVCFQALITRRQTPFFERMTRVQQKLYNGLEALIGGHKELAISGVKRAEYSADMDGVNDEYAGARIAAEVKMTDSFVTGQSLLYVVIGFVVLGFPILFPQADTSALQSYAMIFLFIINPISYLVDLAPKVLQAKVSYDRIANLIKELEPVCKQGEQAVAPEMSVREIRFSDISYTYPNEQGFTMGPVNCEFEGGTITYIVGGNGSGKSTLAKVLTGLYSEQSGMVLLNGKQISPGQRGELFSAVFSDYFLFKKIYGALTAGEGREQEITAFLEKLRMDQKLKIIDGELSTVELSSGQKKRAALLLCYLEDKPCYLFDEWAADQDVEFREFFYRELLPEMRARGKTIIAITHDDRYFGLADKVIAMEMGKLAG